MRILALVTARGGSKRLPGKNIRPLAGKPLLAWTLDAVRGLDGICDILLSTDDPAIAEMGRQWGALVPWLRPLELSSDTASSVDVALHALDWYENEKGTVDGVLLLQPTSPFRRHERMVEGVKLFRESGGQPVVGVSPARSHPWWCFGLKDGRLEPLLGTDYLECRSQDLPPAYAINGAFYLISPAALRETRNFSPPGARPLVMSSRSEAIDIDDAEDWQLAECYAGHKAMDTAAGVVVGNGNQEP